MTLIRFERYQKTFQCPQLASQYRGGFRGAWRQTPNSSFFLSSTSFERFWAVLSFTLSVLRNFQNQAILGSASGPCARLTDAFEAVDDLGEDASVRLAVRVRDEHVHVAARRLAAAVRSAAHRHQPRVHAQCCIPYLTMGEGGFANN